MILIDFSSVIMGTTLSHANELDSKGEYVKHVVINNIRLANEKYRHDCGETVICRDGGDNWRKQCFEFYKARRKAKRDDDPEKWAKVFAFKKEFEAELMAAMPYKVIQLDFAEADDVIGALVQHYREPHMIISGDGDFKQLQRYGNVRQWATARREFYVSKNPTGDLLMKIFDGDTGDGVPNILSDDDTLVTEGKRQKPLTQARIQELLQCYRSNDWGDLANNWIRNSTLIDLSKMPEDVYSAIIHAYEESKPPGSIQALGKYFIKNRMPLLNESLDTFNPNVKSRATLLF